MHAVLLMVGHLGFGPMLDLPKLEDVYAKVKQFPGVVIHAEMVTPSVVPMTFKISPQGAMWAKYPTSEEFIGLKRKTTWMPDRRQYAESVNEPGCPTPVGFEVMWPGAQLPTQISPTTMAEFQGRSCLQMDLHADADYVIHFYVDPMTLTPYGTKVETGGTTYTMVFKSVEVRPLSAVALGFKPPADAQPAGKFDPMAKLVKPGAKLKDFSAADFRGQKHSLTSLLKGKRGLVLNFWFSSCTGCVAEMPFLKKLAPTLASQGIGFVGINPVDAPKGALRTSTAQGLPYPTLVGQEATKIRDAVGVVA